MFWRIEIKNKRGVFDSHGESVGKSIHDLGIYSVKKVEVVLVYNIDGQFTESEVKLISKELLTNRVTQEYSYISEQDSVQISRGKNLKIIEIAYNPGVMDPVESSTIKGIKDLGINSIEAVSTAKKYLLYGNLSPREIKIITEKVLSNKLIQHVVDYSECLKHIKTEDVPLSQEIVEVDLLKVNDKELMELSKEGQLFLNINEMKAIRKYFKDEERNPTDVELETIAQTWSEHCNHKTFRGNINYEEKEKGRSKTKKINSLLKTTIVRATQEINKPWCVSVFHDNAGVIKFDKDSDICFKVETHNHPSALEPFGGASTGIGGVLRDILGTGLAAKPICNTDIFCFAKPDMKFSKLPEGTLHPKRVMKGVVSGVRDYGNKMGIPTINGAIVYDDRFVGNPLVFCGSIGIMPKNKVQKKANNGDAVIVFGGKTGRDGIHGATFSSGELTAESETVSSGAVQIGDPIQEKKVLDALIQARDQDLYTSITDCGAGGLSSAVGEMGAKIGAKVYLEKVPLKYKGLSYTEIWISESQERMVISVAPKNVKKILKIFESENVEAAVIGEFTNTKRLEIFYKGRQVCDLEMHFLHDGTPKITKNAVWVSPKIKDPILPKALNLTKKLHEALSHYNVCSKEWVIRQYDHEVQGASVIKPLVGEKCDGPSDASVIAPKLGSKKGIAVSNGINVRFGMIDPYWMAASCIDEAIRQIISVGGNLEKIAILDNFCWGNPDKPDRLGSLVRCALGCYKAAVGYKVPFISGKDSLNNEYSEGNKSIAIPGTILISAMGVVNDINKCVTMDLKKQGNLLYCVGETQDELGGSIYLDTFGYLGSNVPKVNFNKGTKIFNALSNAIKNGSVRSCHDCSEGGIGSALAEMAFSGGFGVTVRLDKVPCGQDMSRDDIVLFSESNSRFIVEVDPKDKSKFEKLLKGVVFREIGRVEETPEFVIYGLDSNISINTYIQNLKESWQKTLRW